jgi:hypothetical protein
MAYANNNLVAARKERKTRNEVGKGRVMKQKNLTSEDAVNWQLWRKATENQ